LRSNAHIIANILMHASQILVFTLLATSSLLGALSDHLLPKRGLTSCSLHSPDLGASALSLKVHPMSWSIAITPVARKRNTLLTCHCTCPSLYRFNRFMGRTRAMDQSTKQSSHTPLKKPGLRDSPQFNPRKSQCISQSLTNAMLFDGPACPS
jgi:hypothetical protein